jgi:hypothetical protein
MNFLVAWGGIEECSKFLPQLTFFADPAQLLQPLLHDAGTARRPRKASHTART